MDSTSVTLDSTTAFTWDQDVFAVPGLILLQDGSVTTPVRGDVRAEGISFDRELHRNPYGSVWFTSGSDVTNPQLVRVTAEVWSSSIEVAHADVEAVRVACEDATLLIASYGEWSIAALQSFGRSPIEAGYRLDIVFVTISGRS